jgi:hypothetical protein
MRSLPKSEDGVGAIVERSGDLLQLVSVVARVTAGRKGAPTSLRPALAQAPTAGIAAPRIGRAPIAIEKLELERPTIGCQDRFVHRLG